MDTTKVIEAKVNQCARYAVTAPIMKEDYGIYLKFEGVELPTSYQVDFSNSRKDGESVTMIGDENGVLIPTQFIRNGKDVFAFLYHVGADYGKTVYTFCIPNHVRPDRTDDTPEPEQQSVIDQAIAALNTAVAQTSADVVSADASAQSAEDDADRAETAATSAETSATNAAQSEANAAQSASTASAAANNAAASAASAYADAERAEQAAAQSGYLWFYIEKGKLYMDRTPNTQVNFYMENGKLYVEEVS